MKRFSNNYAVIGLGFGDEGKGVAVNSLCGQLEDPLVIRYSGGQQAGHTVTRKDGVSHVFSNFGSGTFLGVPTYWSKYCTFDPVGVANEFDVLANKGVIPKLYIDKRSPITTPYEKVIGRNSKHITNGTCGVGVGATYEREEKLYSLTAGDLLYPSVFRAKLSIISNYYKNDAVDLEPFIQACEFIMNRQNGPFVFSNDYRIRGFESFVFEGSQGLLLDQNIGFFPHVTRSNVGTKNIMNLLESNVNRRYMNLFLVTRAFQTRHGNGPMTNEFIPHNIKNNPKETNILNTYQGQFRKSLLDMDLLKYGMEKDPIIYNSMNRELVITCLDLVKDEYRYTVNGEIVSHANEDEFVSGIAEHLNIYESKVHRISSPDGIFELGKESITDGVADNLIGPHIKKLLNG